MIKPKVLIKGAGEMATAVAHRLARCHFKVCMTETAWPMAVRRGVSFCEAIFEKKQEVEGVVAQLAESPQELEKIWALGQLPISVDPQCRVKDYIRPDCLVDAILAKVNIGTRIDDAPLVIGLGPGFTAGQDVHLVVETNRGHNLGKVIYQGQAEANTGIPGAIGGYTAERVLRVPAAGIFQGTKQIGDLVKAEETVGFVNGAQVKAGISGVLRGLIRDGTKVEPGLKLGDIDPRGQREYCFTISDKARAIAGGVLEGIMFYLGKDK